MATCEVSQIIAAIISAYNSGLDVFKRLKGKKKGKSSKDNKATPEEALLQTSLEHRPKDIRSVYDTNVSSFGHRFEIGDSIAHGSLARTLLALNSGLINVLNNALSSDGAGRKKSQRSLLSISEVAAADALYALEELGSRISSYQHRIPALMPLQQEETKSKKVRHSRTATKNVVDVKIDPKVKSRVENHLLTRGGWIRPRTGPRTRSVSSVVTTNSSRNASTTKLTDHKRTKSGTTSPAEPNQSSKSSPRPAYRRTVSSPVVPTPKFQHIAELPVESKPQRRPQSPENRRLQREPSMLIVPSDFFNSQQEPPPLVHRRSHFTRGRMWPPEPQLPSGPGHPSVATFMTASTKIGEIPEHRWPDRVPKSDEEPRPMPYVIPPPLNVEDVTPRKKKGFRFWKKAEAPVQAFVY